MDSGKASRTAILTAAARAAHFQVHGGEPIFRDRFALALSGVRDAEALREAQQRWLPLDARRVCAFFALRHRYSEDRLRLALTRGVRQVILLGAGLDSLALREPRLVERIALVEIDHPDTQRWKLARLETLGLSAPGVVYVAVDFQREKLEQRLALAGVPLDVPTFVAWLGVTQYIGGGALRETFSFVATRPPGSEIVFDPILEPALLEPAERVYSEIAAQRSAAFGEPWISYFEPEALERRLAEHGFREVERLTPELAAARYYGGQPQGVTPLHAWQMVSAVV